MILYAYVGGTDCMFYKRNLMSFYSFEALQEGLKHLVEIWSAVWLVDGGGVANDINDAAELHQAAEQAALILHVDNSQSGPHASIHVWCDTDSIKPWYKPKIHISGDSWSILYRPQEPSSAAWLRRASQMKYGVKVFWGTGWDSRIHCWRCFHRLPGPGAATGQEECWSWRRWGWVQSKQQSKNCKQQWHFLVLPSCPYPIVFCLLFSFCIVVGFSGPLVEAIGLLKSLANARDWEWCLHAVAQQQDLTASLPPWT